MITCDKLSLHVFTVFMVFFIIHLKLKTFIFACSPNSPCFLYHTLRYELFSSFDFNQNIYFFLSIFFHLRIVTLTIKLIKKRSYATISPLASIMHKFAFLISCEFTKLENSRNAFTNQSDRYTYCQKCFNDIPGDTVVLGDDPSQSQT